LNSNDRELTLENIFEIRKQSALEEAEESEPEFVLWVGTVTVTN
jgi:hypothetical protein